MRSLTLEQVARENDHGLRSPRAGNDAVPTAARRLNAMPAMWEHAVSRATLGRSKGRVRIRVAARFDEPAPVHGLRAEVHDRPVCDSANTSGDAPARSRCLGDLARFARWAQGRHHQGDPIRDARRPRTDEVDCGRGADATGSVPNRTRSLNDARQPARGMSVGGLRIDPAGEPAP
jgi:hypothetical protein